MDISKLGKGCLPDIPDERDYLLEEILGAPEPFDWKKGFDIEDKLGIKLKVENQYKSLSCVGQAWSKYAEVLEIIENGFTDLSAKDIYSRIFFPKTGGAMLGSGAKELVNRGIATEKSNPSYINGTTNEDFMREIVKGLEEEAKQFSSKSYARMTHNSIDYMAGYIRDHNGLVSGVVGDNAGWRIGTDGIVTPPKSKDWGHALYFGKAKMINGKKYVGFLNSWGTEWGDNGWGWLGEDYFGYLFYIWSLIDNKLTTKKMFKLIKEKGRPETYAVINGKNYYIRNVQTFEDFIAAGYMDWNKVKEVDYPITVDGVIAG